MSQFWTFLNVQFFFFREYFLAIFLHMKEKYQYIISMNFCYEDNKTMFITVGLGALSSFIANIWFICNKYKNRRRNVIDQDIEMINLRHCSGSSNENIVLNINETTTYPEFNGNSLPDWVKDEYKQQQQVTI